MKTCLASPIRIALLALTATMSACGGGLTGAANLADHDYRLKHPITVEKRAAVLLLDSPAAGEALPAPDLDRVSAFANDYIQRGAGRIEVSVAGAADDPLTQGFVNQVAAALLAQGLRADELVLQVVPAAADARKVATLRYVLYTAQVPECGTWTRDMKHDSDNAPTENFGCSIQRNKGLMVVNPRDLIQQRGTVDRDANRSADIVDKYRRGVATGSVVEADAIKLGKAGAGGK